METLRNYLENMFLNLPRTDRVMKAKIELGHMMEDRYNDLIAEGKSENEAIGIVISEFGNLNELADELGIHDQVAESDSNTRNAQILTMEQTRQYLSDSIRRSVLTGFGVLLLIVSSSMWMFFSERYENVAMILFFAIIAAGVAVLVFANVRFSQWSFVREKRVRLDFETDRYVRDQRNNFRTQHAALMAIGIMLIIMSVIPSSLAENDFENYADASLFIFVGIGVMLLVIAGMRMKSYRILLNESEEEERDTANARLNPAGRKIQSVYWQTVTCVYLCWSFLTFAWHITWIIWPVAAVCNSLIRTIFSEEDNRGGEGR